MKTRFSTFGYYLDMIKGAVSKTSKSITVDLDAKTLTVDGNTVPVTFPKH